MFIKFIFKFLLVLTIIFVIFIGIFFALVNFTDPNMHKDLLTRKFEEITGQQLILSGPINISMFPFPKAKLRNVTVRADLNGNHIGIFAHKFDFVLDYFTLFSNAPTIRSVEAKDIIITFFEKNKIEQKYMIDSMSGNMHVSCCSLDIPYFKIKIGKSDLEGNLNFLFLDKTTKITGKLKSHLWINPTSIFEIGSNKEAPLKEFTFKRFEGINGDIDLSIDNLKTQEINFQNANIKLVLKDKILVTTINGKVLQGNFAGKFLFQKNKDRFVPELISKFEIHDNVTKNDIKGSVAFIFSDILEITGDVHSTQWSIPYEKYKTENVEFNQNIFSKWFKHKIDLNIYIKNLLIQNIVAQDTHLGFSVNNNKLQIHSKGKLSRGAFNSRLTVQNKPNQKLLQLEKQFEIKDADASEFLKLFRSNTKLNGGTLSLNFNGKSQGNNQVELMANLSGRGFMLINKMNIQNVNIDARHVDLFALLWKKFMPATNDTLLECAAVRVDVKQGKMIAKDSIGLETKEIYILGTGEIDLKDEKLDFTFDLYPKSQMNLEIGSFDNVVYLKGTLNNPELVASRIGLVRKGGSLLLGIATGGMSLLAEKLLKVVTDKGSPCRYVLSSERNKEE